MPPGIAPCVDERLLEIDWARLAPAALPDLPHLRRELAVDKMLQVGQEPCCEFRLVRLDGNAAASRLAPCLPHAPPAWWQNLPAGMGTLSLLLLYQNMPV